MIGLLLPVAAGIQGGPMSASAPTVLGFIAILCVVTISVFGGLLGGIRRNGGKVLAHTFDLPELLMSIVLIGCFIALIVRGAARTMSDTPPSVSLDQIIPNALFFVILTAGVAAFLRFRGIRVWRALGCDRVPLLRAFALGAGLVIATVPLIAFASVAMQIALQQKAHEQELIALFRETAVAGNQRGVMKILLAGAVIAPVCEEFLFRGFFYAVLKRYIGPVASAVFTAALFAAVHLNVSALPSLFILALCLIVAYEASGSLLVPVTMHAVFNGSQLGFLYYVSTHGLPA